MGDLPDLDATTAAQIALFLHRVDHLRWRKGLGVLPEGGWVAECWFPDHPPAWALASAAAGDGGRQWCPRINPNLLSGASRA
jgi:hypothetical protein